MRSIFVVGAAALCVGACDAKPGPAAEKSSGSVAAVASPALSPAASASTPADATAPKETLWEGKLVAGHGIELRLVLHVVSADDGALHATLDSPDQGANAMKVDTISLTEGSLRFAISALKLEYDGKLAEGGTEVDGEFRQMGMKMRLAMRQVDHVSEVARPQTPKPPFPYRAEDVSYANVPGKVTLAGTLTTPSSGGPFPAVILITGSGAQDRDETLFMHKPFMVIADALTRRGIAVLRVDDRGVGGSTGSIDQSTTADFAGDVLAGIAFLKTRKDIDPARIGLLGHSEGGEIAPLVASQSKDVAFIVLLAGPGLPGGDILLLQSDLMSKVAGAPEATAAPAHAALQRAVDAVKASKNVPAAELEARLTAIAKEEGPKLGEAGLNAEATAKRMASPWFRYFINYDPRPALRKVHCPVLALNGSKDLQVPPKENLAELGKALAAAGNTKVTLRELPGLNHLFQTADKGLPTEYAQIEETMAPAALTAIGDWVVAQTEQKPAPLK